MKICAISDTHSQHRKITIPECDLLIVSGDITFKGELSVIEDFSNWLTEIPAKNKAIIFGNHEIGFEAGPKRQKAISMITNSGANYLEDDSIEIDGLKIWGSPVQPRFFDWEFNRNRGKDIDRHWQMIPNDTNILITHGPPYSIMDEAPRGIGGYENVGCVDLLNRIADLKELKLMVFGHIHAGYGIKKIDHTTFVNASTCNEKYQPINPPIIIDI